MKNIVEAKNLTFEYLIHDDQGEVEDTIIALDHINVTIEEGEFVAVLGHNGSGKSTFAKHLNGILSPKSGTLWVNNIDLSQGEHIWEVRKDVGMVFQNPDNQMVATIVEEDVAFGPENLGIDPKEIRKRVDESLEKVGMSEYKRHAPHLLSGGQKQRVAIAGILAMKPECIIFDEPTAMLDPSGRKEVIKNIKEINKEYGITIVLITHYMDEAAEADRIVVMDDGKLIMGGTPKEVFSKVELMKKIGLDVPQVTELSYELSKEGINLDSKIINVDEMVNALCQLK